LTPASGELPAIPAWTTPARFLAPATAAALTTVLVTPVRGRIRAPMLAMLAVLGLPTVLVVMVLGLGSRVALARIRLPPQAG